MIHKNNAHSEPRDAERALISVAAHYLEKAARLYVIGSSLWAGPKSLVTLPYKGGVDAAIAAGSAINALDEPVPEARDCAVVIGSKQKEETDDWIARALESLAIGGTLIVALENEQGGKTLDKKLAALGLTCSVETKCKSRVLIAQKHSSFQNPSPLGPVRRNDGLWTWPGVFSWKKTDSGTKVFQEILADKSAVLAGDGADFGAGIGELSRWIVAKEGKVRSITLIEHDIRALECARRNYEGVQARTEYLWADIPSGLPPLKLDFILMNPPFHIGKDTRSDLGMEFIRKAVQALKANGELYLVANVHLPYEDILRQNFKQMDALGVKNGFKVLYAKYPVKNQSL